jgi:hypothetical protein
MENNKPVNPALYTEDELMARLKFFIGVCLSLTLVGIVFVVLYSIIFVTQPLNAISPIDSKFFELIIPIATFLTGTLSGIMLAGKNPDAQMKALEAATSGFKNPPPAAPKPSAPAPRPMGGAPAASSFGFDFTPPQTTSPLANAITMPVFEEGDPTHRNSRND